MRVNVYAEEMTDRIEIIEKNGYTGVRFYLELPVTIVKEEMEQIRGPFLHYPGDDHSSAVTFWGKRALRSVLQKALTLLDGRAKEPRNFPLAASDCSVCGKPQYAICQNGHGGVPPMEQKSDVYMVHVGPSGALFVKELELFRKQGGFSEDWGLAWTPVVAKDLEDARQIADSLTRKNELP